MVYYLHTFNVLQDSSHDEAEDLLKGDVDQGNDATDSEHEEEDVDSDGERDVS